MVLVTIARPIISRALMKRLASQIATRIDRQLQAGRWKHCAIYEDELTRIWPLDEKDRQAKIAQFAKECGYRLAFYQPGLCAIFTPLEKSKD